MNRLHAIIVDDEALARAVIREHCGAHADIAIVAECANGFEAVKAISEQKPDLVFLDIQMPKLSGFEVLDLVEHSCHIIFVTAFDQFALKAFEVHAVDYLLKPFSAERFQAAIERVRELAGRGRPPSFAALAETARMSRGSVDRLLVRDGSRVTIIPVADIDYIEAQDDYVRIVAGGKSSLKQDRLSRLETELPPSRFVRIHRSYIVNVDRLARIEPMTKDSRVAILRDGTKLPVSKAGWDRVKEAT